MSPGVGVVTAQQKNRVVLKFFIASIINQNQSKKFMRSQRLGAFLSLD
jgi:hypothetical protein